MTEFNGALDRWLEPPYEAERDALDRERREGEFFFDVRGERCPECGSKTDAEIDNGKGWIACGSLSCDWQRTEDL